MQALNAPLPTDQAAKRDRLSVPNMHLCAFGLYALSVLLFWQPLVGLADLSLHDENSSHILLIPVISAFLIYLQRKRIFQAPRHCVALGVPALLTAVVLRYALSAALSYWNTTDRLSVLAASIVLGWIAIFIICYGIVSFKSAIFPLLYLALMIPFPVVVMGRLVSVLQKGSADSCYALFHLLGIPVLRHGFRFSLPGFDIEVAQQCSGIHSALALFVTGLLASHVLLQGTYKKVCFALCIFPIAILKNAIRIVTLTWLAMHVNPAIFEGPLHRRGGLPFSLVALALMAILLWLLRRPLFLQRKNLNPRRG
jgi:exosortase